MARRPRTDAERTAAREKRDATTKALYEQLAQRGQRFAQGEEFQTFLKSMVHFHRYSVNNQCLIFWQYPDASTVNAYKRWQELGRQVRKGEKGIRILAPRPVTTTEYNSRTGQEEEQTFTYYVPVSVFAYEQTDPIEDFDGEPWQPFRFATLDDDRGEEQYRHLAAWLTGEGIPVHDRPSANTRANGSYDPNDRSISVRPDRSPLDRLRTLIHEAAHALHHDESEADLMGNARTYAEIVAESSSYVVMHALGFDSMPHAEQYIGANANRDPDAIEAALPMIQRVTHRLLDAIEAIPITKRGATIATSAGNIIAEYRHISAA